MSAGQDTGATVQPQEPLARFIYSSSHIRHQDKRVKHNAFMPAADNKTSVFRTNEFSETEIWATGDKVGERRKQALHGRGDIVAADVFKVELQVIPSEPPPHHANIEGWPAEKSAQKLKAIDLADAAKLVIKPAH